jgi:hypothetical protein
MKKDTKFSIGVFLMIISLVFLVPTFGGLLLSFIAWTWVLDFSEMRAMLLGLIILGIGSYYFVKYRHEAD